MSSNGGGGDSSSSGEKGTSIDARGQKEVDIQSTQQLWGALVPNVVLGLVYLAAFLYFRRRAAVKDVYDPKRRRLVALAQGRGSPTIRGLPEAWKERSPSMTPTPLPPPDVPAKPWSWFLDLWRISDAAIITYTGADAYMFLRFLRVGLVRRLGFLWFKQSVTPYISITTAIGARLRPPCSASSSSCPSTCTGAMGCISWRSSR